eukprot:GHVL01029020.1.p2 GENE.GHVL01029020.1~~GHVL01029020.1.p2  ORF type:complete len:307 (-),score=24.02 GHVL01029020.1:517-1437(-)
MQLSQIETETVHRNIPIVYFLMYINTDRHPLHIFFDAQEHRQIIVHVLSVGGVGWWGREIGHGGKVLSVEAGRGDNQQVLSIHVELVIQDGSGRSRFCVHHFSAQTVEGHCDDGAGPCRCDEIETDVKGDLDVVVVRDAGIVLQVQDIHRGPVQERDDPHTHQHCKNIENCTSAKQLEESMFQANKVKAEADERGQYGQEGQSNDDLEDHHHSLRHAVHQTVSIFWTVTVLGNHCDLVANAGVMSDHVSEVEELQCPQISEAFHTKGGSTIVTAGQLAAMSIIDTDPAGLCQRCAQNHNTDHAAQG